MTGYSDLDPAMRRVLDALLRASLRRRGMTAELASLDDPATLVEVTMTDDETTRIHVNGVHLYSISRVDLAHAVGLARLTSGRAN